MWWAGKPDFDLYVGARTVAVCRGRSLVLHERLRAGADAVEIAGRWVAEQKQRGSCAVWVSGAVGRPLLLPMGNRLPLPADRRRVAQAMAKKEFAFDDAHVWLDERGPSAIAIVLRNGIAREIERRFRCGPMKLRSLKPWWTAALTQQLAISPGCSLLGVADGESLTSLGGAGESFTLIESTVPQPGVDALAGAVQRAALRAGALPGARRLVMLDFDAPATGTFDCPFGPWILESRP